MVELMVFSARWCGPCKAAENAGVYKAVEEAGYKVTKIDIDQDPGLARQYGVMAVPMYVILRDGQSVNKIVGARTKDVLLAAIEAVTV